MHETLLDSKTKQKILITMTEQPTRCFSLKELAMRTKVRPAKLKAHMNLFIRNDLVKVMEKKRQFFFQINRHSGMFEELSQIFGDEAGGKKHDILEKILKGAGGVRLAALSGIFVGLPNAQVDLLIVGRCRGKRLEKAVKAMENIAGQEINFSLMTEEDYRQRLYSFDWFLKEIMEHDPVVIIDKLNKKKKAGRGKTGKRMARVYKRT